MAHFGIEDERSQDGSTASNPRPLTKLSKLMIVFKEDAVAIVKLYIEKNFPGT